MRELGMSEMWPKLEQNIFTTFRFTRKDTDWAENEVVKVVYRPRSKERKVLGIAIINKKEVRSLFCGQCISEEEAVEDGFKNKEGMIKWLLNTHGDDIPSTINKLTIKWQERRIE